ncbi:MAG: hypothetical protein ACYTAO_06965, partial [Planctomycetota bacterium]|jgi:hypothetical protein
LSTFSRAADRVRPKDLPSRERLQNMSEEERAKFREEMKQRFEKMSEEEQAKFRQQMRAIVSGDGSGRRRFQILRPEDRQKAIKTIEAQLAKYKAAQNIRPEGGDRDLSEDERAKLREKMTKVFQDRQKALQAIIAQIARLQGRRQPAAEGVEADDRQANGLKVVSDAAQANSSKRGSSGVYGFNYCTRPPTFSGSSGTMTWSICWTCVPVTASSGNDHRASAKTIASAPWSVRSPYCVRHILGVSIYER